MVTLNIAPLTANASTVYSNGVYRGLRHFSYVETDFTWYVDDNNFIYDSSAYQWAEGLGAYPGSTTRTLENGLEHGWACVEYIRVGFSKLGYSIPYNDYVSLHNNGNIYLN